MEEFLNSQSCACRELTERVIIAIVTRHHMCAHIFVLCRLEGLQGLPRGEMMDNDFALAEHLSLCPVWRLAPGTSSVYVQRAASPMLASVFLINDVVNCLSSDFSPMITQFRFATLRWHCRVSLQ